MASIPSLIPRAPQRSDAVRLETTPFWIGAGAGASLRIFLPGIADRHLSILERGDGYWVIPSGGSASVNGSPVTAGTRLANGDVIELAPGCSFQFDSGEVAAPVINSVAPNAAAVPSAPPKKKKHRPMRGSSKYSLPIRITFGVALVLVIASMVVMYRAVTHTTAAAQLSNEDTALFDSLLVVAYDHIERGTTLLEIGAPQPALQDFAAGINALKTSRLREHPYIVPRIEALEASVAAIYREKHIAVPTVYSAAKETAGLVARSLRESLTPTEFATRFADVRQQFLNKFGQPVTITGTDHAEHVSLYGKGSAIDIRSRNLTGAQTAFLVGACRNAGIRVKDFSQDSVLQRQIQSAVRAGLADRAGTGLHIHIDRFANRRDAYTVP
jgi:hypothetical protein